MRYLGDDEPADATPRAEEWGGQPVDRPTPAQMNADLVARRNAKAGGPSLGVLLLIAFAVWRATR